MKGLLKNNIKLIVGIVIGLIISGVSVYAAILITADKVSYLDGTVEDALDELYKKAEKITEIKKFCELKSGKSETVGAKYECDLGDGVKRNFFILAINNDNSVNLIMEQNITQGTSKTTMSWNDAMKYFSDGEGVIYKNSWINVIDLDLPKAQDIANAVGRSNWKAVDSGSTWWCFGSKTQDSQSFPNCNESTNSEYNWLYNYTRECIGSGCDASASLDSTEAYGYWTRDLTPNSANAWDVDRVGNLGSDAASNAARYGVRPVITILKSNLYE